MRRFFVLLLPLITVLNVAAGGIALADVNNFVITDFSADYYLNKSDPQGQMRVVEKISVDFSDQNHGILRAIPQSYQGHPLHLHINNVTSGSGAPASYTTSTSNGNEILRIGNPNQTVTGNQEYTLDYSVQNVITFYKDHDELYWNVNGDQWGQPFATVEARIHLPSELRQWSQEPKCFVGSYGTTSQSCVISNTTNSTLITTSASNLSPYSTLTFVAGFEKGYFQPMTWRDYLNDYAKDILEFIIPVIALGGGGFVWWFMRGRDARGTGIIIPQYDAPDQLSPLEVGTLVDFRVDTRDLTATIIDLAIRRYICIVETDKKTLVVRKTKSYALQLLNKDWDDLNTWEREIMAGLFGAADENEIVSLSKLSTKLYPVAKSVGKSVNQSLAQRGYFVSNPSKFMALPAFSIIILIWIFGFHVPDLSAWLFVGITIGAATLMLFYHFMAARTAKGVAAKEHILGLKVYLQVAEKDRIAMLQSPDAPYAPKTNAPERTVELFERLLPYAIVLKVEKQWAKKFENIYTSPPEWYAGNYTAFSVGYLAGALGDNFAPAMSSGFSAPRSSGSSGFGGGGFAGGGGGGGGGGGW